MTYNGMQRHEVHYEKRLVQSKDLLHFMFTSMHISVDVNFCERPSNVYISSKKAVHQQHVIFLINTWLCACKNLTIKLFMQ